MFFYLSFRHERILFLILNLKNENVSFFLFVCLFFFVCCFFRRESVRFPYLYLHLVICFFLFVVFRFFCCFLFCISFIFFLFRKLIFKQKFKLGFLVPVFRKKNLNILSYILILTRINVSYSSTFQTLAFIAMFSILIRYQGNTLRINRIILTYSTVPVPLPSILHTV